MRRYPPRGDKPFRYPRAQEENESPRERRPFFEFEEPKREPASSKGSRDSGYAMPEKNASGRVDSDTAGQVSNEPESKELERREPERRDNGEKTISGMGVVSTGLTGIELATAFVPWQMYGRTLDLREALRQGGLFPELMRTPPRYKKPGTRGEE